MSQAWPTWMIRAQDVGLIGPASLRFHHEHALGFSENASVAERLSAAPLVRDVGFAIDLGSGGGLPGLVLAAAFPTSHWTLLDARLRSCEHLEQAIADELLTDRVTMCHGRGEAFGRDVALREQFQLATARGFAKPAVTAEIGSSLLEVGGLLVVSEPPESADRWPLDGLGQLGLEPEDAWKTNAGHYRSFRKTMSSPERYPRRVGIPEKRLLFGSA